MLELYPSASLQKCQYNGILLLSEQVSFMVAAPVQPRNAHFAELMLCIAHLLLSTSISGNTCSLIAFFPYQIVPTNQKPQNIADWRCTYTKYLVFAST